jgi:hypothetical protein
MMARTAEESSTTLIEFTFGGLSPLCDELVHQGHAGLDVLPGVALGALDVSLQRGNTQFIVFPSKDQLAALGDSEGFAKVSGDDDPAICWDFDPYSARHATILQM